MRDVSDMSFWRQIEAKYLARQVRGVSISEALMFKSNRRNLHVSAYIIRIRPVIQQGVFLLCGFVTYRISIIIIFFERKIIIMDKTELITSIKAMTAEERVKTAYTTMDEEILKAEQIEEKFYNKKQVVMQRFEKEYGDYRDWSEEVKKEYRSIANKINDEELTERVNLVTEYENKIRLKMWSFLNKYQIAAMSFEGKRKAAENSQTPSEFLYSLASAEYSDEENQHEIFLALAQNKNISEETMKILAKSEDTTVQWLMVNNCNVTEDIIRELVRDYAEDDDMLIEAIANCEITPLDILANLSKSEDECVREGVAENLKTPPETLLEMALNKDERFGLIYNEIAMNPNSTVEILSILLDKKHEYSEKGISNWTETIFASVKQNRNATDEIKSRVDEYMEQITANELKEVAKAHKKEYYGLDRN